MSIVFIHPHITSVSSLHPSPVFPAARMRVRLGARARSPRQPKLPPSPCDHRTPLLVTELLDTRARLRSVRALSGPPALPPYFLTHLILPWSLKIGGLLTWCVLCESNVRCHRIALRHSIARRGLGGRLRRTDNSYVRSPVICTTPRCGCRLPSVLFVASSEVSLHWLEVSLDPKRFLANAHGSAYFLKHLNFPWRLRLAGLSPLVFCENVRSRWIALRHSIARGGWGRRLLLRYNSCVRRLTFWTTPRCGWRLRSVLFRCLVLGVSTLFGVALDPELRSIVLSRIM